MSSTTCTTLGDTERRASHSSPPSICDKVRMSCAAWMGASAEGSSSSSSSSGGGGRGQNYVRIHTDKLQDVATRILEQEQNKVTWDEENWHYQPPPTTWPEKMIRQERIALYILALDAINFCFWPSLSTTLLKINSSSYSYEYANLACTLTAMAQADHAEQEADLSRISPDYAFLPETMRDLTVEKMKSLFEKHFHHGGRRPPMVSKEGEEEESFIVVVPPDLERRCALWNEVGRVLLEDFQGSAMTLIQSANQSAVLLVQSLYDHFPGFRDQVEVSVGGTMNTIFFLKRAQICVGDLIAALDLQNENKAAWSDMAQLTTFADYRLPQLLRHWQVFEYCDKGLQEAVDGKKELQPGSDEEISIRAATVVAVERLVQVLNDMQEQRQPRKDGGDWDGDDDHTRNNDAAVVTTWTAVQVDWYLWQVGERMDDQGELQPHHRVRTIFY